ncbi:MAG TPA: DUF192 domain-containing protein [Candidatus Aquilonibacter sp.]|nr:DUF192 domain-containing protein [Candidatus Aquilonibacter sp.]
MFSAFVLAATLTVQHLPTVTVRAPKATLTLQVAKTEDEREFGLMNVTKLAPHTGMVFVFDQDALVEFWMKNTLVPLDMVFVGPDGIVRSVAANVPATTPDTPDDKIPRRSAKAKYVIELPAGEAEKDGITGSVALPEIATLSP